MIPLPFLSVARKLVAGFPLKNQAVELIFEESRITLSSLNKLSTECNLKPPPPPPPPPMVVLTRWNVSLEWNGGTTLRKFVDDLERGEKGRG